jgi:choline dehydrogenase-like flavoprotein
VRGVQGLRIVDAGVIPHVPNGTHSTVCVVASRAADLIADFRGSHLPIDSMINHIDRHMCNVF